MTLDDTTCRPTRDLKPLHFALLLLAAVLVGSALRLYQIGIQIMGGDEWNSIRHAIHYSFSDVFTQFNVADNCVPLTAYYKVMLETVGLDDWGIRIPPLAAGLASLILFPLLIRSACGARIALVFSLFLAISPFHVFYSRFARPYSIVALLSGLSLLSFYFWLIRRKHIYAAVYVVAAILAPFFNLFSLPPVLAPLLYCLLMALAPKALCAKICPQGLPKMKQLAVLGLSILLGMLLWFLPRVATLKTVTSKINLGFIDFKTLEGTLALFSGSRNIVVMLLCLLLFLYGIHVSFSRFRTLGGLMILTMACQILSIAVIKPEAGQYSLVFARYSISCLPLWLLFISQALWDLGERLDRSALKAAGRPYPLAAPFSAAIIIAAFFAGPLPSIYKFSNSFTNHNDYQLYYSHPAMEAGDSQSALFPGFYVELKTIPGDIIIIETPFMVAWRLNNYHIYQKHHGKRVKIGHTDSSFLSHGAPVMHENLRLANFVNVCNGKDLQKSGAEFVVIHKNLLNELLHMRGAYPVFEDYTKTIRAHWDRYEDARGVPTRQQSKKLITQFRTFFGLPYYDDRWIAVFRVR